MKFSCDKCSAQYMISDDKIGPSGVKVRCKKCGNVIVVRRAEASASADVTKPSPAPPGGGAPGMGGAAPGKGLDAELGKAFDHAFGDTPPSTAKPSADMPAKGPDLAATQMMGEDDAAKITAAPAAAAAAAGATEWYVAIGQAQVGPLPASEVKKKWESGDVGPDSLVWRPGMGDWSPLSSVADLAAFLAPVPRPAPKGARDGARPDGRGEPAPTPAPAPTWKPVGASALAALASEEIATRNAPEPRPQAPRPVPGGAKSLMDALPDGGGVDPTGAIPLAIKALEQTVEKKIERRTSVARGAQATRHRRGVARAVTITVVVVLIVVGAAAAGGFWYMNQGEGRVAFSLSGLTGGESPAAGSAPAPAPAAARAPVAAAPPASVQPPAAEPPKAPPAAEPPRAPPAAEPSRPGRTASATKQARREPAPKPAPKVAEASPPPPPPAPEPKKKKGDLLDFESNDSALDDALGQTPSGRSVYVPPARRGGGSDVPDKLSSGDINAAVAGRIDSLRRCVSEQKSRDPSATGILKMRWTIGGDGSVRDVRCLTSEFAQGPFAQCIAGVLKSIRFPRSQTTGQEVTFPFNF